MPRVTLVRAVSAKITTATIGLPDVRSPARATPPASPRTVRGRRLTMKWLGR